MLLIQKALNHQNPLMGIKNSSFFQEEQLGESGKARLQTFSEYLRNMTAHLNPSNNHINVVQNLN